MIDVLNGVRAAEYSKLWSRLPGSLGAVLWIGAIALLGWEAGFWAGLSTVVALVAICRIIPSEWKPAELIVDIAYPTVMNSTFVRLLWVALVPCLWLVWQRGPYSILMVFGTFLLATILPFAINHGLNRLLRRAS